MGAFRRCAFSGVARARVQGVEDDGHEEPFQLLLRSAAPRRKVPAMRGKDRAVRGESMTDVAKVVARSARIGRAAPLPVMPGDFSLYVPHGMALPHP